MIAGILCYLYLGPISWPLHWPIVVGFAMYAVVILFLRRISNTNTKTLIGILGLLLVFSFGFALTQQHDVRNHQDHFYNFTGETEAYIVQLTEAPLQRERSLKLEAKLISAKSNDRWAATNGKLLIYIINDTSKSLQPRYGDRLVIKGQPQAIPPPNNPAGFDYRQYLANSQIYFQDFVRPNEVKFIHSGNGSTVYEMAISARAYCDNVFASYITDTTAYAVANALVLGNKDQLTDETQKAYSEAGAMHVLAVSGLHVGIITGIFFFLLGPLRKRSPWSVAILIILLLWSYALLTGLSPSVLRAVCMFTVIVLAEAFKRRTNFYNTLAFSALVLLCWDPFMIKQVGFQLSYLAVAGIVYLQPVIRRMLHPQNKIVRYAWELTAVSIAAQAATFPLSLYYFHQMPTYFLFSNVFIIIGATLALCGGILLLAVSWFEMISVAVGYLLTWVLMGMNYIVDLFQHMPSPALQGFDITGLEVLALYLLIFGIIFYILHQGKWLITAFTAAVFLCVSQVSENTAQARQQQLIVYDLPDAHAIDLISGNEHILISSDSLLENETLINYNMRSNWWRMGLSEMEFTDLANHHGIPTGESPLGELWVWQGKSIMVFDEKTNASLTHLTDSVEIDLILIRNNAIWSLTELSPAMNLKQILVDRSVAPWNRKRYSREADSLGVSFHDISKDGAFITEWP